MATPQYVTSSNNPRIDPDHGSDILDEWGFITTNGELHVEIRDGELHIHGYSEFNPYRVEDVDTDDSSFVDREHVDRTGFLSEIAAALHGPLILQHVSHTKTRYPLGAVQYLVGADGKVSKMSFTTHQNDQLPEVQAE
jgi:hypothetical protein